MKKGREGGQRIKTCTLCSESQDQNNLNYCVLSNLTKGGMVSDWEQFVSLTFGVTRGEWGVTLSILNTIWQSYKIQLEQTQDYTQYHSAFHIFKRASKHGWSLPFHTRLLFDSFFTNGSKTIFFKYKLLCFLRIGEPLILSVCLGICLRHSFYRARLKIHQKL